MDTVFCERLVRTMRASGKFDEADYLLRYPDVRAYGMDPLEHYVKYGITEKRTLNLCKPAIHSQPRKLLCHGSDLALYDSPLHIDWLLTDMCNYKCSYCFGQKPLDKSNFKDFKLLAPVVDYLFELNRSSYTFSILGGEPTIYPNFFELLELIGNKLGQRVDQIYVVTNGSRNYDFYKKLAQIGKYINICMVISVHTEYIELDHIKNLLSILSDKIIILFNHMVNPVLIDKTKFLFYELLKLRLKYAFKLDLTLVKGRPDFCLPDKRFTKSDIAWRDEAQKDFDNAAADSGKPIRWRSRGRPVEAQFWEYLIDGQYYFDELINIDHDKLQMEGKYDFKSMYCCQGTRVMAIWQDGSVRGSNCGALKSRYNIYRENPYLHDDFIEAIKCPVKRCSCCNNMYIPKFADKGKAESFIRNFRLWQKDRRL